MKRHILRLLVVLNVGLLATLLLMWVQPDGSLRGIAWKPPAPRLTDFAGQLPTLPSPAASDTASFVGMLERPLFSASRRPPPPPPPPPAVVAEAPPDNLSTAKLTGIFNGGGLSGVIIRIADKDKRVQLNQSLDGWTLKSISGREVTFTKGSENRVLQLHRAGLKQATPNTPAVPGAAARSPFLPAAPSSTPPSQSAPSQAPTGAAAPPAGSSAADAANADATAPKAPQAVFGGTRL